RSSVRLGALSSARFCARWASSGAPGSTTRTSAKMATILGVMSEEKRVVLKREDDADRSVAAVPGEPCLGLFPVRGGYRYAYWVRPARDVDELPDPVALADVRAVGVLALVVLRVAGLLATRTARDLCGGIGCLRPEYVGLDDHFCRDQAG